MKIAIDHVLGEHAPAGLIALLANVLPGAASRSGLLAWAAAGSIGLFVLTSAIEYRMTLGLLRVGQRMVYAFACDLFAQMLRRSLPFHSRSSVGDLMTRITTDNFCIYRLVDTLLIGAAKTLLIAAIMTASWGGALTIGGLLVFLSYLTILQGHFQTVARAVTAVQSVRGEIDRVLEILDHEPEVRESPTATCRPSRPLAARKTRTPNCSRARTPRWRQPSPQPPCR